MGFLIRKIRDRFEDKKPKELQADIRMISGCEDKQTSADVSNVASFSLPDPAGRAGGACTSAILNVLYKDHENTAADLSYVQVLEKMREILSTKRFTQIPQLSASHAIDINEKFDLVPNESEGTRRALMIGINYVGHEKGQLSGCHNDVRNMMEYIKDVHGFEDDNITLLLDEDGYTYPTKKNILDAVKKLVHDSQPNDSLYFHYSGHGSKVRDDDRGEEEDGYDETLVPIDYKESGMIRDDDLYDTLIKPLKDNVHLVCLMDCCHSGTVLDLPYIFKANGEFEKMEIDDSFPFEKLFKKFGSRIGDLFD